MAQRWAGMILCVDPDSALRTETEQTFRDAGFEAVGADSLAAAREKLDSMGTVDCLVTEQRLSDGTGLELIRHVRETTPDTTCVLFTAVPLSEIDTEAFGSIVAEYLAKGEPAVQLELLELVEHSLAFRSQTAYPLPKQEDARLAALERYTAEPEALGESLDRLSLLATELFDLDAAGVKLIDAHQERFLSCHGIAHDPLDREETVCTYAILDDGVTVVEDVLEDARFAMNERLAQANIQFYASAPLVTPDGHPIGTFCVYDVEPRSFSERDRELLSLLAEEAMEQLMLRRRLRDAGGADDA